MTTSQINATERASPSSSRPSLLRRRSTILLALFLTLRLGLVLVAIRTPQGGLTLDSPSYVSLARGLRLEGTYHDPVGTEDVRRTPVYPAYLALFTSRAGLDQAAAIFGQLLLLSLTGFLLLGMLDRLGNPTAGLVAAWLVALSPNANLWALTIMSEVLFSFLLVAALFLLPRVLERRSFWPPLLAGMLLGFATLARPVGIIVCILWPAVIGMAAVRKWWEPLRLRSAMTLAIGSLVLILPWMVRNGWVHGTLSISDVGTSTLESFNFAIVVSEAEGISRNEASLRLGELGGTWEQFRWLIAEYPWPFVRSQIAGVARVFWGNEIPRWATVLGASNWQGFGVFRHLRTLDMESAVADAALVLQDPAQWVLLLIYLVSVAHSLFLLVFALIGVLPTSEPDGRRKVVVVLSAVSALGMILVNGAAGQARFRVPVEPFLAILAGYGWVGLRSRRHRRLVDEATSA